MQVIKNTLKSKYALPPGHKDNYIEEVTGSLIIELTLEEFCKLFWIDEEDRHNYLLKKVEHLIPSDITDVEIDISQLKDRPTQIKIEISAFCDAEVSD